MKIPSVVWDRNHNKLSVVVFQSKDRDQLIAKKEELEQQNPNSSFRFVIRSQGETHFKRSE